VYVCILATYITKLCQKKEKEKPTRRYNSSRIIQQRFREAGATGVSRKLIQL
jgi:hypothetical protein